jgi:hypothetical protein
LETRLVHELPSEDGRLILVRHTCEVVDSCEDRLLHTRITH